MMESLKSKKLNAHNQLETSYVASFSRQQKEDPKEISSWLILNYLDDLLETESYFQEKFGKNIGDYKFIPNVGLAVPFNDLNATGRLFCFLPLPIPMPFLVSVHGYFAPNTNRRSLWLAANNEDLAIDGLANLKIEWNKYLFEKVLPKAWVKFLRKLHGLPNVSDISDIRSRDIHKFWPIVRSASSDVSSFCRDLLKNVIEILSIEDCLFKGPSLNTTEQWLSLSGGYLDGNLFVIDDLLNNIIGNIGFPVITAFPDIISVLKKSRHKNSLRLLSPAIIRSYLNSNRGRWENNAISRQDVLQLFKYILEDRRFDELEGLKMIPLADGTLGTLTQPSDSYVYIEEITDRGNDGCSIFKNQLNSGKLIDKSIDFSLYECLYNNAKAGWNGWHLNIKVLDEIRIDDLILIIRNMINENENRDLSVDKIENGIEILKRIAKIQSNARIEENDLEKLDGLLIPSTENKLVDLDKIHFNDMGNRHDEEMNKYIIAHHLVTRDVAKGLGIQTLKGKIFGNSDTDWKIYEQHESLTTRIKNILKDYSMSSLFKEFLQNADDAGATKFSVYVDERQSDPSEKLLFSEEMKDWQGPAIWIYNDAKFTDDDFQFLLRLGTGGKSRDNTKIGRFGIGFNCAFHVTDLPSFISGKYIAFLDPHAKFLPEQGYPSKIPRGTRINFIEKKFKERFPDQCYPYKALGCDFSENFKGTLFRLPLRTHKLAEQSLIV